MSGRLLYTRAISPLHTGTGQATGVIDLPVAREKLTSWPYLPGSTIKGVLRDACEPGSGDKTAFYRAFGPETDNAHDHAGALAFCDGHLLCFPVRSFYGTFAWLTCPLALHRWHDDALAAGVRISPPAGLAPAENEALVAQGSVLAGSGQTIFLEELDLDARVPDDDPVGALAGMIGQAAFDQAEWQARFRQRLAVVTDDLFTQLAQIGTEVTARIRLSDQSKTVERGGLWYEEAIPPQTIFAGPVLLEDRLANGADLWRLLADGLSQPRQIGGNASVGRGLASLRLWA